MSTANFPPLPHELAWAEVEAMAAHFGMEGFTRLNEGKPKYEWSRSGASSFHYRVITTADPKDPKGRPHSVGDAPAVLDLTVPITLARGAGYFWSGLEIATVSARWMIDGIEDRSAAGPVDCSFIRTADPETPNKAAYLMTYAALHSYKEGSGRRHQWQPGETTAVADVLFKYGKEPGVAICNVHPNENATYDRPSLADFPAVAQAAGIVGLELDKLAIAVEHLPDGTCRASSVFANTPASPLPRTSEALREALSVSDATSLTGQEPRCLSFCA